VSAAAHHGLANVARHAFGRSLQLPLARVAFGIANGRRQG
jgi:hypothetical protein